MQLQSRLTFIFKFKGFRLCPVFNTHQLVSEAPSGPRNQAVCVNQAAESPRPLIRSVPGHSALLCDHRLTCCPRDGKANTAGSQSRTRWRELCRLDHLRPRDYKDSRKEGPCPPRSFGVTLSHFQHKSDALWVTGSIPGLFLKTNTWLTLPSEKKMGPENR